MASTEPPAVARRRLRLALRKLREEGGVTQAQVAEALQWSLSKVNRIESGEVGISNTDLKALLAHLGVTDESLIRRLGEDAQVARRRRGWWEEARFREHLNKATRQLLQFESEASVIRCFNPTIFPGLIQTRDYAQAIVNFWSSELAPDDRAVRVEVRMRRFDHVFERPDRARYLLILDESVILRDVGGLSVMAAQLNHVLELVQKGRVMVRIVPLGESANVAMVGPFMILDLDEGDESSILYRESGLRDEIVQAPRELALHRRIFQQIWRIALSDEATVRLITARAATLLASLDRNRPIAPLADI
jgi:transcriptional regulator with XRE-family HTH domain